MQDSLFYFPFPRYFYVILPIFCNYSQVFVPLAVPLLLLDADLRKCFKSTGTLLKAFIIGSFGTCLGTIVAYALGKSSIYHHKSLFLSSVFITDELFLSQSNCRYFYPPSGAALLMREFDVYCNHHNPILFQFAS